MKPPRLPSLIAGTLLTTALAIAAPIAWAQDAAPVRLLVGLAAGGSLDILARELAVGMEKALGRPVVVENRAGAGGQIAAQTLKAARPDGNTLLVTNSHSLTMIPNVVRDPGYDVTRDFVPVALLATNPDALAASTVTIGHTPKDLAAFADWVRREPGRGNIGVPAPASAPDFTVSALSKALDIDLRSVAYRGGAPVVQDLLAGQIAAGIASVSVMQSQAASGKLKLLAVNGTSRSPLSPDVPTFAELGIQGMESQMFIAVMAPSGTPEQRLQALSEAIDTTMAQPRMRERLSSLGMTVEQGNGEELAERIRRAATADAGMVSRAGFAPQ